MLLVCATCVQVTCGRVSMSRFLLATGVHISLLVLDFALTLLALMQLWCAPVYKLDQMRAYVRSYAYCHKF